MTARHTIAALLAVAALGTGTAQAAPCHEDQPCWSWSTMGNHKRGVVVAGRIVVVGPCGFARLAHRELIDWTHTPRLRGDTTARRIGCKS